MLCFCYVVLMLGLILVYPSVLVLLNAILVCIIPFPYMPPSELWV